MFDLGSMPLVNTYSLCNQTVTVYAKSGSGITRTVHSGAYLEMTDSRKVDKQGESGETSFLLVIPGADRPCNLGDKVVRGTGEAIGADAAAWWRGFIPAKNPDICVVRKVQPCYWDGAIVHWEMSG